MAFPFLENFWQICMQKTGFLELWLFLYIFEVLLCVCCPKSVFCTPQCCPTVIRKHLLFSKCHILPNTLDYFRLD